MSCARLITIGLSAEPDVDELAPAGLPIDAVESVVIADPQRAIAVFEDGIHEVERQAVRIARDVSKDLESLRAPAEIVDAGRVQAGPDVAVSILEQRDDLVFRDAVRVLRLVAVVMEAVRSRSRRSRPSPGEPSQRLPSASSAMPMMPVSAVASRVPLIEGIGRHGVGVGVEQREAVSRGLRDPETARAIFEQADLHRIRHRRVAQDFAASRDRIPTGPRLVPTQKRPRESSPLQFTSFVGKPSGSAPWRKCAIAPVAGSSRCRPEPVASHSMPSPILGDVRDGVRALSCLRQCSTR